MACMYMALSRGRRPGLYTDYSDIAEQIYGFPRSSYSGELSRAEAIKYMEREGIERSQIRLFIRAFPQTPNFQPRSFSTFDEEMRRFARTQGLQYGYRARQAKVDALYKEIIYYYLPEGLMLHQVDDVTGDIKLTKDQTLRIYQAMCAKSGKRIRATIKTCITELKCRAPYVDLIEFVDCARTGKEIRTFYRWQDLCEFTRSHPIDVSLARKNDLLSPLLHKLSEGPPKHIGYACRRWLGNRKYAPCEPEQDSRMESRDILREQTPIIKEEPLMEEMSNCTLSDSPSSILQDELDTPLGSLSPERFYHPPFSLDPVGGPPGFTCRYSPSLNCIVWTPPAPRLPSDCSDFASQTASEASERTFYSALEPPPEEFEDDDSVPPSTSPVIKNEPRSSPPFPLPHIPLSRRQEPSPENRRVKQKAAAAKLGKCRREAAPSARAPPAKQRRVKCLNNRRITDFFKPV